MNPRRLGLGFALLAGAAALAIAVRGNPAGDMTNAAMPVDENASVAADDTPMPYRGVLDFGLGEPIADTVARSSYDVAAARNDALQFQSFEIIDLKVRYHGRQFDFGRMGGGHGYPWTVEESARGRFEAINFYYQNDLLTLAEAFARARALRTWLEQGGFVPAPRERTQDSSDTPGPFEVLDFHRVGLHAEDWGSAAAMLAADRTIGALHLYTLEAGEHRATVQVERVDTGSETGSAGDDPPDWQLFVRLGMPPWRLAEINHPERAGPPEGILSPADQLPSRAEAGRALLVWGQCAGEDCPPPRRDTVLTSLRCRPDVIFRGDPVKVICHLDGYYRLGPGRREPLQSDCYYFWRGQTSGGPWQVLAIPDAEFC